VTDLHKSGERASVILDSHSHVSRAGSFDSIFCSALLLLRWLDAATDLSQLPALTHFIITKSNASLLSHFQNKKKQRRLLTGSKNSRFRKMLTVTLSLGSSCKAAPPEGLAARVLP